MYLQNKQVYYRTFLVVDLVLTAISFVSAYAVKTHWLPVDLEVLYPLKEYYGLFFLLLPIWSVFLSRARIYEPSSTEHPLLWVLRLAKYLSYGFLVLVLVLFLLRVQFVSRLLLFLFMTINFFVLTAAHITVPWIVRLRTRKDKPRIMLIGYPESIEPLIERMNKEPSIHVDIKAIYLLGDLQKRHSAQIPESWMPSGAGILQHKNEIPYWIHEHGIDEIFFAIRAGDLEKIGPLLDIAEEEGIVNHIVADVFEQKLSHASWDQLGSIPLITLRRNPSKEWEYLVKGVMDIVIALMGLILAAPLMGLIAILIRRDSKGPVFFRQQRVGFRGHVFTMIKFRTMVEDAESMRKALWAANQLSGPAFKMPGDPRVTKVGRFLRRHALDELPQLLNVLAGNMSLVGPRPALPDEVAQYEPWQRRRLSMKPGVTGLWQVSGQEKEDFNDWVFLDLEYIDRWSLTFDLRLLCMTLPHVILGRGM